MIEYTVQVHDDWTKWFLKGKLHRENGPALEYLDGFKQWFQNGEMHRLDGPALVDSNGTKKWYKKGLLHRLGGPAVVRNNGSEWWIDGVRYISNAYSAKLKRMAKEANDASSLTVAGSGGACTLAGKTVTVDGKDYRLEAI